MGKRVGLLVTSSITISFQALLRDIPANSALNDHTQLMMTTASFSSISIENPKLWR